MSHKFTQFVIIINNNIHKDMKTCIKNVWSMVVVCLFNDIKCILFLCFDKKSLLVDCEL